MHIEKKTEYPRFGTNHRRNRPNSCEWKECSPSPYMVNLSAHSNPILDFVTKMLLSNLHCFSFGEGLELVCNHLMALNAITSSTILCILCFRQTFNSIPSRLHVFNLRKFQFRLNSGMNANEIGIDWNARLVCVLMFSAYFFIGIAPIVRCKQDCNRFNSLWRNCTSSWIWRTFKCILSSSIIYSHWSSF